MVTVTRPVSTIRNQVTPMAKKSARKVSKKVTRPYVPAKYAGGGPSKPSSHAWKIADASTHNLDDEVDRSMKKTQFMSFPPTPKYREGDSGFSTSVERAVFAVGRRMFQYGKKHD